MWVLALLICTTFLTPLCARNLLDTKQLIATDANTIIVTTADELLAIATNNDTNNGYAGKTIKLTNDITIESDWASIGTESVPFVGTFDGGRHTIDIWGKSTVDGLFGYVGAGAKICNIQLKSSTNPNVFTATLISSATGTADKNVVIENCVNYISLRKGLVKILGGIVNIAEYTSIFSCANFGVMSGVLCAGGIVGSAKESVRVSNCYNRGGITAVATYNGDAYAYGIGGNSVINSYSICDISASADSDFGYSPHPYAISNGDTIQNCYFSGTINNGNGAVNNITQNGVTVTGDGKAVPVVTDGADLYTKALAAGWDFAKTWVYDTTDENKNVNGYPQLRGLVAQEISVTIDLNGGEYSGETTIVKADSETCELPTNITRKGYTFKGYTVTSDSGTGSVSGTTYTFGEAAGIVQAQWQINTYTITYNLNGGAMSGQKATYTVETETFTLPTPTRSKYKFVGWTGSNGATKQTSVTITKGTIGNLTYTANWESTVTAITIDVTVSNDREYIIYMLDASGEPTRQFVVKDTTKLNIEVDKGTTFSVMVYETLYLRSTINGVETRKVEYKNIQNDSLNITIKLMGANNVNNWLVI